MRIRIQSTNFYTFNRKPRFTLRQVEEHSKIGRADSIGGQEAGKAIFFGLKFFKGYKLTWKRSPNHHHRGNAVLVRKRYKVIGKRWFKANDGAGTKWTPPRNVFILLYEKRGTKIAHINTHFHVVPEEKLARMNREHYGKAAEQYVDQVRLVNQLMRQYKREGYVVFVTMDANTRPRPGYPDWRFAAYNYLEHGPWKISRRGVDLIIHDSSLVERVGFDVIEKEHLGKADHPTIIGEYELLE